MKKYGQPQMPGFSTPGYTEGYIQVGVFDPDNRSKNPSETLTITFVCRQCENENNTEAQQTLADAYQDFYRHLCEEEH